jgi:hypothetical protein
VSLNVFDQDRPKGFPTGIDCRLGQMRPNDAVSVLVDFKDLFTRDHQSSSLAEAGVWDNCPATLEYSPVCSSVGCVVVKPLNGGFQIASRAYRSGR